jgi:hypothetical protein
MSNIIIRLVLGMLMSFAASVLAAASTWSTGPYWVESIKNEREFRTNNPELFTPGRERISSYNVCLLMWWIAGDNPVYLRSLGLSADDQASQEAYIQACRAHNRLAAWLTFSELRDIVQGRGLYQPPAGQLAAPALTPVVDESPAAPSVASRRSVRPEPKIWLTGTPLVTRNEIPPVLQGLLQPASNQ